MSDSSDSTSSDSTFSDSTSSDSDFVDGFARSSAARYQRRNNGNVTDPRALPGPSGVVRRSPQDSSMVSSTKRACERTRRIPAESQVPNINARPEDYQLSEWFIQEMPQKTYFPQIGDDVVYFRQGHEIYLSVVRMKYLKYYDPTQRVPWKLLHLSDQEYCRVINVEFVLDPSRMCKLKLRLVRDNDLTDKSFTIVYHPVPEAPDFLVLRDIYHQCSFTKWRVGQRFRCAMPNNTWRRGMIISIDPLDQRFPNSCFMRYRVRWDNDTVDRLSPWDLASNNYESMVSPRYARIAMRREDLDLWQGVLRGCDWPLGDRDLFLETIAPKLEMLLELLICEPFVDAGHERTNPAYLATVAYPVDIGLILLRLDSGFYRRISSVRFDIGHMLRNALRFYTPNHSYAKIAKLSTEMLLRIIRDCRRNIPLKIIYRQSLDTACYTETETEEDIRKAKRKKKLKRLKKPRFPTNQKLVLRTPRRTPRANRQAHPNDENIPPVLREILNNKNFHTERGNMQLSSLSRHLKKAGYFGANVSLRDGKIKCIELYMDAKLLPKLHPQKDGKENVRPLSVLQVSQNDENQLSTSSQQESGNIESRTRHSNRQEDCVNDENQPSGCRRQECDSRNDPSLWVIEVSKNDGNQSSIDTTHQKEPGILGARKKCRRRDHPYRYFTPPVILEYTKNRPRRISNKKDTRQRLVLEDHNIKANQPLSILPLQYAHLTLTQETSQPDTGTLEMSMDCGSPVNECQHQEHSSGSPTLFTIDCTQLAINRSLERVRTPPKLLEIEWNQPSTSQTQVPSSAAPPTVLEIDRNQPSTSRSQERASPSSSDLDIDQNQPSTSRQRPSRSKRRSTDPRDHGRRDETLSNRWAKCRGKKNFNLESNLVTRGSHEQLQGSVDRATHVGKVATKRPKETSSSDSSTTSFSDSNSPVLSTSKRTPKRARMQKRMKLKAWRADCMRVLQTLWEDEDAAMFRESAFGNHRRSVIEWVSLEYIMVLLKCGAYKDPNAIVDEVHTMLLHARSLVLAGNRHVARIIDKLSLLFDELIDPVVRKWRSLRAEREEQEVQEHRNREGAESDLTIDEESSSSSVTPESPQSPS